MISEDQRAQVRRLYFSEHWKLGTIASETGLHHDTVRDVVGLADRKPAPKRPPRPSKVDPYVEFLRTTLAKYPALTATRCAAMIRPRGYVGSDIQVRRVIRRFRLRPTPSHEAFLKLRMLPGEQAQVDWADLGKIRVGQIERRAFALVLVLSYSRDTVVYFSHTQAMEAVIAGHLAAFERWGGAPRKLLYDNMKTVVIERQGTAIRYHDHLLELAGHWGFEPVVCRPRRGNEKGRVERRIRDLRASMLAGHTFHSLQDYRVAFETWRAEVLHKRPWPDDPTHKRTVGEVFAEEKSLLLPPPVHTVPLVVCRPATVGKQPYVVLDSNRYSVPSRLVGTTVTLALEPERLRVLDGQECVAVHVRRWGKGEIIEDPEHVRELREHKRRGANGAARNRLLDAVPVAAQLLSELAARQEPLSPATAALIKMLDAHGPQALAAAITEAMERGTPRAASVRWILDRNRKPGRPVLPVELPDRADLRSQSIPSPTLESYDVLNRTSPRSR